MRLKQVAAVGLTSLIFVLVFFSGNAEAAYFLHETEDYYRIDLNVDAHPWSFYLDKNTGIQHGFAWDHYDYTTKWCLSAQGINEICVDSLEPIITVDENSWHRIVLKVEPQGLPQFQPIIYYEVDLNYTGESDKDFPQNVYITMEGRTLGQSLRDFMFSWEFSNYDAYRNGVFDERLGYSQDWNKQYQDLEEPFYFENDIDANFFNVEVETPVSKSNEFQWHYHYIDGVKTDYSFTLQSFEDSNAENPNQGVKWSGHYGHYGDIPRQSDFNFTFNIYDAPVKSCNAGFWTATVYIDLVTGQNPALGWADFNVGGKWAAGFGCPAPCLCSMSWQEATGFAWMDWTNCDLGEDFTCTNKVPTYCYTAGGDTGMVANTWAYRTGARITTGIDIIRIFSSKGQGSPTKGITPVSRAPIVTVTHPNGGETLTCNTTIDVNWTFTDADEVDQNTCTNSFFDINYGGNPPENEILDDVAWMQYCTDDDSNYATLNTCTYPWALGDNNIGADYDLNIFISDGWLFADDNSDNPWEIICPIEEAGLPFPVVMHAAGMNAFPWWIYIFVAICGGVTLFIVGVRP